MDLVPFSRVTELPGKNRVGRRMSDREMLDCLPLLLLFLVFLIISPSVFFPPLPEVFPIASLSITFHTL